MDWACDAMLLLGVHVGDTSPQHIRILQTKMEEEATYFILRVKGDHSVRRVAISDFLFADHSGAHVLH